MYFPIGWPKQLNVKHNAHHLAANNDRTFIAVISNKTIGIWSSTLYIHNTYDPKTY